MATSCKVRKTDVSEVLTSQQQSLKYIEDLVLDSVASIFHAKRFFPDKYFQNRNRHGIDVKMFRKRNLPEEVEEVYRLTVDAMDAVKRRYLHQLILSFYLRDPNVPFENYAFVFAYDEDSEDGGDVSISMNHDDDESFVSVSNNLEEKEDLLRVSTRNIFETVKKITAKTGPLPEDTKWTYTIRYYPETPDDYRIPNDGFYRMNREIPKSFFNLGIEDRSSAVDANWTKMGIKIKTRPPTIIDEDDDEKEKIQSRKSRDKVAVITGGLDITESI